MPRILLIGATGMFGSRLARMLAQIPGIDLVVTSRQLAKAESLALTLGKDSASLITGACFTHGAASRAQLVRLKPWLVIDAAGPFQRASYETAQAAIDAGAHWIDLADAADYIRDFASHLDELARQRGVTAITGASSTPALSFAAVQSLTQGWCRVERIEIGIYPAGRSAVGEAVLSAVLSYTGEPVAIWRNGRKAWTTGWGVAEASSLEGLPHRYRSAVATCDHELLSRTFGARDVSFYAGLESPLEHLGLTMLARLRARRLLPRLEGLAPYLLRARRLTAPFCGSTGGMTVEVSGADAHGRARHATWTLRAANGDGPNVPVLPALALVRKLLGNQLPLGAFCAAGLLDLRDIAREMAGFAISASSSLREADAVPPVSPRARSLAA